MNEGLRQKTRRGIFWSAIQRFSTQGLQFLITLFMARLLTPQDYGVIGMLGIFFAISSVFVDCGFTSALIHKQNRSQEDLSTVFYFNIIIGLIAYLIIYTIAPLVADFYKMHILTNVLRIMGIVIIINSFCAIQMTLLIINIDFKTQTKISIFAIIISGTIGITLAFYGYTYWALVIQAIISASITTLLYWYYSKWRPSLIFSIKSFTGLFSFGSKLLVQGLIDNTYNSIYPIVIGKFFSASTLGNYSRAESYANFPSVSMTGVMQKVTYPVLCQMQENEIELAHAYRKFLRISAFVIFPLMAGLSALSYQFVVIVIGHQWEFCSTLLQILCFSIMWYPIHAINLNLLQVKGRTDLSLKLEIIKKIIGIIVICISVPLGIVAMCYFRIATSLICLLINTYYTGKLINLGFIKQMRDLAPTLLISISMFTFIIAINSLFDNLWAQLGTGFLIGSLYYFTLSFFFNKNDLKTVISFIKK